ncbi:formate dehydrogenase accessory sulfurtransferase FdhD [Desulfoplanes sp.]
MTTPSVATHSCLKFHDTSWDTIQDMVPRETRIDLVWPGNRATLWTFPHDPEELARGHALVEWCRSGEVPAIDGVDQNTYHLTPCPRKFPALPPALSPVSSKDILGAMEEFFARDGLWETTGCFHRMALFDPKSSTLTRFVEDIARHNCVDRLAGWSVQATCPPGDKILLCSSRVTASLMRKITRAGLPMVVSRSATTMAAIEQAQRHGITVVGFARGNRFTVFCDPHRHVRVPMP